MLPQNYHHIQIPLKNYLSSYRACIDCKYAISNMRLSKNTNFFRWRIEWAGLLSVLRASMHLLREKDAKSCLPEILKRQICAAWNDLGATKPDPAIYWKFIHEARNSVLKEYEFSAHMVLLEQDGTLKPGYSFLSIGPDDQEVLIIKNGYFKDRYALDVASEAAEWLEDFICGVIRTSGYDPEDLITPGQFLPSMLGPSKPVRKSRP